MIDFFEKGSSVSKGETLIDTARNIEAMGVDVIVLRHQAAGSAEMPLAGEVQRGERRRRGCTSIRRRDCSICTRSASGSGRIAGLKVAIVGDIANSRVARSNLWGLKKLGAEVILVGSPTLFRGHLKPGARVACHDFDSIVGEVDVIDMLPRCSLSG